MNDPASLLRQYMRLLEDEPSHFLAPDVGTLFDYNGSRYRVEGWLKERDPPIHHRDEHPMSAAISDILYQTQQKIGPKKLKLRFCFRKDATHVAGAGVSGCVAPIEAIKVVGRVDWPPDVLADALKQANMFAAHGSDIA